MRGFADGFEVLVAELLVPIGANDGIALFTNDVLHFVTLGTDAGQVPTDNGLAPKMAPHFPCGYAVEPD